MISRRFLEIVGYLRTADKWRPKVNAMTARKPLIFGIIWTITILVILLNAGVIIAAREEGYFWYGSLAIGVFFIAAAWSLWSGPFGLEGKIFKEERQIRICYRDSHDRFELVPDDERMVVFGLLPLKDGELTLTGPAKVLTQEMLKRDAIADDLRLNIGKYTYLGIAFMGPFGEPDVSHEDLMAQLWIKDALKAGLTESDIHSFTRNLEVAN